MPCELPKTKVCGVTRLEDLDFLKTSGVEAVGLNLVPKSKRYIPLDVAVQLAKRAFELGLKTVAVVMDPTSDELARIASAFTWDFLQLHGNEQPNIRDFCHRIAIIKAAAWSGRREEKDLIDAWSADSGGSLASTKNTSTDASSQLAGFLLDAYAPGEGGGTGKTARWDLVYPRPKILQSWPIMLAGGLTPENVGSAIRLTRCEGVDTASGVELSPGIKSSDRVQAFATAATAAFSRI